MAVSDTQKVDLLYKKVFGVAKTDLGTNKSPSNESVASPSLLRGDIVWTQSSSIPAIATAVSEIVIAYKGVDSIKAVADTTTTPIGSVFPTWKTSIIDWIPPEFGATYFVKVYADNASATNPESTGTQIFDSGTGGVGEWYFDYQSGVLNFIGGTIPSALTSSKVIFISGYVYTGLKGTSNIPSSRIGNLNIKDNSISAVEVPGTSGDVILEPNGTGFSRIQGSRFNQSMPVFGESASLPSFSRSTYMARVTTTSAAPGELTFDGLTGGTTNRLVLPNFYAYKVSADIVAKTTTETATWTIKFLASREENASTIMIVGNTLTERIAADSTALSWTISAVADTVNGCISLFVTGEDSKTVRWLAAINTLELYQT
jgi:hypothetical protein